MREIVSLCMQAVHDLSVFQITMLNRVMQSDCYVTIDQFAISYIEEIDVYSPKNGGLSFQGFLFDLTQSTHWD